MSKHLPSERSGGIDVETPYGTYHLSSDPFSLDRIVADSERRLDEIGTMVVRCSAA